VSRSRGIPEHTCDDTQPVRIVRFRYPPKGPLTAYPHLLPAWNEPGPTQGCLAYGRGSQGNVTSGIPPERVDTFYRALLDIWDI